MSRLLTKIIRQLGYALAAIIILIALSVSVSRLLTPYFNKHLPNFQKLASQLLEAPVLIQKVSLDWHVYEPELTFEKVEFLDKATQKPRLAMEKVKINFGILRSLFARQVVIDEIKIAGMHLTVHQPTATQFDIEGLAAFDITDKLTGSSVKITEMLDWLATTKKISLNDLEIQLIPAKGTEKSFTVNWLSLKNTLFSHTLSGRVVLNQDSPSAVTLHVDWTGRLADVTVETASIYAYFEDIDLMQWLSQQTFHNLQITKGVGSAKVWAQWNKKDAFKKIQTTFQLYSLEIKSLLNQQLQSIPRISGDLGWQKDQQKQILAGEQIFIDLPAHLWPVTGFTVILNQDQTGKDFIASSHIAYLDIHDTHKVLQTLHLLDDKAQKKLNLLNPRGEINDLSFSQLNAPVTLENITFAAKFKDLGFAALERLPGAANLSGALAWRNDAGDLSLQSDRAILKYNRIFANDIVLDQLIASIHVEKKPEWLLSIKDLYVKNKDVQAQVKMQLTLPAVMSPHIDLTGDFNVFNAAHFSRYLPLAIFEPGLVKWLNNAFLSGSGDQGQFVIQGMLSDFPFDQNKGKFFVSLDLKDVDLNYAPNWPLIRHTAGKLVFSGRSMLVDVKSAQLFNLPLENIVAKIPSLGDSHPQILSIDMGVKGDLDDLLHYVHQSPLQNTVGKELDKIQMQGPMTLKLNLAIPLKNPENTQVNGLVDFVNARLALPQWKLLFEPLSGAFQFTDHGIEAKNLQGKFMGENAVLDLMSQHPIDRPPYLLVTLNSQVQIGLLQSLVGLKLPAVIAGSTPYTAELRLYSQKDPIPTELLVHTELKGISLKLPAPYGKTADESRALDLDILLREKELRTKISYAKLVSAALSFNNDRSLHFVSGELNLGGEAVWQQQPGLLVTANFKALNGDDLQTYFSGPKNTSFDIAALLRGINLNIDTLTLASQTFKNAQLRLEKIKAAWHINFKSNEADGELTVPDNLKISPIQANFDKLNLKSIVSKTKQMLDPRSLPAVNFLGREVRLGDKYLGTVRLDFMPNKNGLTIKAFQINSELVSLTASGDWTMRKSSYSSHLEGNLTTNRMSDLIVQWGFSSNDLIAKKADVTFDLSWPDAPYAFTSNGLSGTASLSIGKGSIINLSDSNKAKIGLGRLLNFLSISNLSRRLSLDFSDLTEKGFGFDYIKGDFNLKNGSALTENTHLDGPIAKVALAGRIGIAAKDLDILLSITPYVTSSIPVVAAAAAVNPFAGIALWAAEKVVGGAVSKVTTYKYNITGSWDNPSWNQGNTAHQ